MPNLKGIVQQLRTERDRAQKDVERLNAALMALGNLGSRSGGLRRVRLLVMPSQYARIRDNQWRSLEFLFFQLVKPRKLAWGPLSLLNSHCGLIGRQ